jgi:hypothetical protein
MDPAPAEHERNQGAWKHEHIHGLLNGFTE